MFALRCATSRAFAHPSKQLATIRNPSRAIISQISKPTLQRSFYQARWLAEERRVGAADGESPTSPLSSEEMSGNIREESVASSQATGGVQGALRSAAATVGDSLSAVSDAITSSPRRSGGHSQFTEGRTIYIGNLSFDAKDADLEAEFSRFGSITSARLAADPSGQLRGFGFVEFSTPEEATAAIEGADQRQFLGRRMNVQLHVPKVRPGQVGGNRGRAPSSNGPSKTLFIGNMPFQMSDKDLNDLFREVSNVKDIRVAIDRRSGQPRGFAHADFFDEESAAAAKEILQQKSVYGRNLRVDFTENSNRRRNNPDE